jgi:hypothetical protein
MLFAQVLERDLDALIVEFLEIAAELIAAVRPAVEELAYDTDRRVWFPLKHRCASNIDSPIKIKIVDVTEDLSNQQSRNWFVANAQHLGSRPDGSYVLVTPTNFIIKAQAGNCGAIGVELDAFGSRHVVPEMLGKRHLYSGNEVDHHAHLLALGSLRRSERCDD